MTFSSFIINTSFWLSLAFSYIGHSYKPRRWETTNWPRARYNKCVLNQQNPTCLNQKIYIYIYTHETEQRNTTQDSQTLRERDSFFFGQQHWEIEIEIEMDNFFLDSVYQEDDNFWDLIFGDVSGDGAGEKSVSVLPSSFRPYMKDTGKRMMSPEITSSTTNVKRRMVNLLTNNWEKQKNAVVPEKERCRRHMMKERARREKQKHSYLALHSLLPFATKVH